jgi:tripartite-type tricarboxylate transporter receptor subunit TctC
MSPRCDTIGSRLRKISGSLIAAVVGLAALVAAAVVPARAQSPAEFYKGKTVFLVIGYSVGGGYDAYARLLSAHLGKHIPGNPTVVPQNMAGAGSLKSVLYLDTVAPKDGTVIATFGRNLPIDPLLDTSGAAKFDARKFSWIGSVTSDVSLCISWHTSQIKKWDDMLTKQYTAGGNQAGSDPDLFANIIKGIFDAKIKLVTGFPGTADMSLAMERGEIDGFCGLSYSTLKAQHPDWIKDKKVNLLLQASVAKDPDLPNVPLITELVKSPEQVQVVKLLVASQVMARPFAASPGIPADRKAALIKAFADTMKDPAFLADAQRMNMDVNPVPPAAIDKLLADLYATPKDIVVKAQQIIASQPAPPPAAAPAKP